MKSSDIPFEITSRALFLEKKANRITQFLLVIAILLTILIAPKLENSLQAIYNNYELYQLQNKFVKEINAFHSVLEDSAKQRKIGAFELTVKSNNNRLAYSKTSFYENSTYPKLSVILTSNDYNDIVIKTEAYPTNSTLSTFFEELTIKELKFPLESTLRRVFTTLDSRQYALSVPDIRVAATSIPYKWVPYIVVCLSLYARELINELVEDISLFVDKCRTYDSEDNKDFFSQEFIPLMMPKIDKWLQAPFTFKFSSFVLIVLYLLIFVSDQIFIDFYEQDSPLRVSFYGAWRIPLQAFFSIVSVNLVGGSIHVLVRTIINSNAENKLNINPASEPINVITEL